MSSEAGHVQITEFSKEVIPMINWQMEDLFCQYGIAMPYFMLDFDFPDYSERPDWVSGYNFNLDWGEWGYWLPWFNNLLGFIFDEAHLPRWQMPDMSEWSWATFNDYVSELYDNIQRHYVYGQSGTFTKDEVIEGETSGITGWYKWKDGDGYIHVANKQDTSGESVADFEDEKVVGADSGAYAYTYYYDTYGDTLLKYISRTGYSCVGDNGESIGAAWDDYDADPDWSIVDVDYGVIQLKGFYGYQTGCGMGLGWRANGTKTYCALNTSAAEADPSSITLTIECDVTVSGSASDPTIRVYYHNFGDVLDSDDWTGGELSGYQSVSDGDDQTIELTLDTSHVNIGGTSRYRISLAEIETGSEPSVGNGWYIKINDLQLKLGYNE